MNHRLTNAEILADQIADSLTSQDDRKLYKPELWVAIAQVWAIVGLAEKMDVLIEQNQKLLEINKIHGGE